MKLKNGLVYLLVAVGPCAILHFSLCFKCPGSFINKLKMGHQGDIKYDLGS